MEIDPGEGYRLLTVGEIRQEGDEWLQAGSGKWMPSTHLRKAVGKNTSPMRRKIGVAAIEPDRPKTIIEGESTW